MVSKLRSDGRQDSDRPHFYSQYWIDVAMGKTSPMLPEPALAHEAPEESDDDLEADILAMAPKPEPKPAKAPKVAEKKPDAHAPMTSLADLAKIDMLMKSSAAMDDDEAPDISAGLNATGPDITLDVLNSESAEPAEEGFDEFDEESEEDDDWGGGRRKPKQGKAKRHERHDY